MKKVNILFITEIYSPKFYGVYTSMNQLISMINGEYKVDIIYPEDKKIWYYDKNFRITLERKLRNKKLCAVIHIHGLWQYPQYIAAKLAIKYNKPFIISPHGMLEPWVMEAKNIGILKSLKKKIYLKLIALPLFRKAIVIHAVTELEKNNLQKFFPENEIVVIPNAINLEEIDEYLKNLNIKPENYILFIGRLHPIKGVELLVKAFNKVSKKFKNWKLKIVGPEKDKKYVKYLKELAKDNKNIEFLGEIWNPKKKYDLIANAWVSVFPSYSEVVGMVNLESAASYTPTITTYQTGLLSWGKGGNILINPKEDELQKALEKVLNWSFEERLNRGRRARKFVEENFSYHVVKKMWLDLYNSISKEA